MKNILLLILLAFSNFLFSQSVYLNLKSGGNVLYVSDHISYVVDNLTYRTVFMANSTSVDVTNTLSTIAASATSKIFVLDAKWPSGKIHKVAMNTFAIESVTPTLDGKASIKMKVTPFSCTSIQSAGVIIATILAMGSSTSSGSNATTLQGRTISTTIPLTGQGLVWDGLAWSPKTILSGNYLSPISSVGSPIVSVIGITPSDAQSLIITRNGYVYAPGLNVGISANLLTFTRPIANGEIITVQYK